MNKILAINHYDLLSASELGYSRSNELIKNIFRTEESYLDSEPSIYSLIKLNLFLICQKMLEMESRGKEVASS